MSEQEKDRPDTVQPESVREAVCSYIMKKYKSAPEHLWKRFPDYVVFRHEDNRKWYALLMDVPRERLGLYGTERVDVLNVKTGEMAFRDALLRREGYMPPYHLKKGSWISILLDGTVPTDEVCGMIDVSFEATRALERKKS